MEPNNVLERKTLMMAEWYQDFQQIDDDIWVNLIILLLFTEAFSKFIEDILGLVGNFQKDL